MQVYGTVLSYVPMQVYGTVLSYVPMQVYGTVMSVCANAGLLYRNVRMCQCRFMVP